MYTTVFGCYFVADARGALGLPVGTHHCFLASSSESRIRSMGRHLDGLGRIEAYLLRDKFWWVRGSVHRIYPNAGPGSYDDTQSTEELFDAIRQGFPARVMDGPFDTREDAHYALDVAWESPE